MRTQEEIEQSIREQLPVVFGRRQSIDPLAFREKFYALVDYALAVSEPFLKAETIRYQTILLGAALVFISIPLLRIDKIKVGEATVTAEPKLLALYAIFLVTIAGIFLAKAYLDFQRAGLVRNKNAHVARDVRELISRGILRKRIQHHFWIEISNAIGRSYKTYADAASRALNAPPGAMPEPVHLLRIDNLDELRKDAELALQIAGHEKLLAALTADLSRDEQRFDDQAEIILSRIPPDIDERGGRYTAYLEIRDAYGRCLEHWFKARDTLQNENLKTATSPDASPEQQQANAMLDVLRRIVATRNRYALLEIVAPVAFAIFALLVVYGPDVVALLRLGLRS